MWWLFRTIILLLVVINLCWIYYFCLLAQDGVVDRSLGRCWLDMQFLRLTDLMLSEHLSHVKDGALAIKQPDFKLSAYLWTLERTESLKKILLFHKYDIPSNAIPDLPKGDSRKIVLLCLQQWCHEDPHNLYNKETAIEFHHLFNLVILCYCPSRTV